MATTRRLVDASTLARVHTELAIETLADAAANSFKDSDRIAAANALLDRGHGKPLSVAIQVPMNRQVAEQLARMSDSDLMGVIDAEILPSHEPEPLPARSATLALSHERDPLLD